MAITLFTGPPGAGKSYALVEQVIVPGVLAGRRVLTNVAGVDPAKVLAYCQARMDEPSRAGRVVLFDGDSISQPGFFPTQDKSDDQTTVKGGDLLVVDEWKLYVPKRGKLPPDVEPFLRWHRHLVGPNGEATDVAIATQIAQDVHMDFRGLIERSYKFKKLKAVGLNKSYAWQSYEGHLQAKGEAYKTGNGTYKDEITELYKSYAVEGEKGATELKSDNRVSIVGRGTYITVAVGIVVVALSAWWIWRYFSGDGFSGSSESVELQQPTLGVSALAAIPPASPWRIVGHVISDGGTRIILQGDDGAVRVVTPEGFSFDGSRPVRGYVDGSLVIAEDRPVVAPSAPQMALPGVGL